MDSSRNCSVEGCGRVTRRGRANYCEMHYYRIYRTGHAGPAYKITRQPDAGKHILWSRIEVTGFCWNWCGHVTKKGYGRIDRDGVNILAHRAVYEELVGLIPAGLVLDHLCRNRRCVNPDHLEPVTQAENIRRGLNGVLTPDRTFCKHGHNRWSEHALKPSCLDCHLIDTHARRGRNCSVDAPCHLIAARGAA